MTKQRRQAVGLWVLDQNTNAWVPLKLDKAGSIPTISIPHQRVHKGEMWSITYTAPELADDGTIILAFQVPASKVYHMTSDVGCGGDATVELIEGATITDKVTHPVYNMNREIGDAGAPTAWLDPTLADGTVRVNSGLPGGQKNQSSSAVGGTRPGLEWVCNENTTYALRLTNLAGATKMAFVAVNLYEEPTGRSG